MSPSTKKFLNTVALAAIVAGYMYIVNHSVQKIEHPVVQAAQAQTVPAAAKDKPMWATVPVSEAKREALFPKIAATQSTPAQPSQIDQTTQERPSQFEQGMSHLAAAVANTKFGPKPVSPGNGLAWVNIDSSAPNMWVLSDEAELIKPKDGQWWQLIRVAGSKYPWGEQCISWQDDWSGSMKSTVQVSPAKAFEREESLGANPTIVEEYTPRRDITLPYMKTVRVRILDKGQMMAQTFYYSFEDCDETASQNREEERARDENKERNIDKYR